jgi:hypothetical protein
VIKGLSTSAETETVTNFISSLSYGVLHDSHFNPYIHSSLDKYRCPLKGVDMARNQFTWYLRRVGALISSTGCMLTTDAVGGEREQITTSPVSMVDECPITFGAVRYPWNDLGFWFENSTCEACFK